MNMPEYRIQTGIRFKPEILDKITFIAQKNRRSFNGQMEFLAMQCIEEFERENGSISLYDD